MRRKIIIVSVMLVLLGTVMANAQTAYTSVHQNGTKLTQLGTAAYDLSTTEGVVLSFDDAGQVLVTIGENTVATLPTDNNGQMVVEFENTSGGETNKVSKTVSADGYATLYSPFQLQVPDNSDVVVYAPTYDAQNHVLKCNSSTAIASGNVIPVGTGLLLKNAGSIDFTIASGASTVEDKGALSGSALKIPLPTVAEGQSIYTLGHEAIDKTKYGFFKYTGTTLGAGLAYLLAGTLPSSAKCYALSFAEDNATDTDIVSVNENSNNDGKYLVNGNIIIVKNNKKYNANGQEVR